MGHHHGHGGHGHHRMPIDLGGRARETRNITLIGAVLDGTLGALKIVFGIIGNSHALFADGVHSFSDLFTDIIVLLAAKQAYREADKRHPYGHGRIETLAAVVLAATLSAVALGILWHAFNQIENAANLPSPATITLILAIISVGAKELIYQMTMRIANKLNSRILEANAWHSRSDAASSVIVIIGVVGTWAGWVYLDTIAAMVVALIILKVSWDIGWPAMKELIDTAVDESDETEIRSIVESIEDVESIHMLRTRQAGHKMFIDAHVQVAPDISVSEGHEIGERIRRRIHEKMGHEIDITLHIDPEDDAERQIACVRPARKQIMQDIEAALAEVTPDTPISQITIHYLGNGVDIEVVLPMAALNDALAQTIISLIQDINYVRNAKVLGDIAP